MNIADRRDLNRGFGDGLARAFEMVATPVLFALLGYGLDRVFNSQPLFLVAFTAVGVIGMFAREWYVYKSKMLAHDEKAIWGKR